MAGFRCLLGHFFEIRGLWFDPFGLDFGLVCGGYYLPNAGIGVTRFCLLSDSVGLVRIGSDWFAYLLRTE